MENKLITTINEALAATERCNDTCARRFLMENIRRLSYLLKKALAVLEEKPQYVYIVEKVDDPYNASGSTHKTILTTTDKQLAHETLVKEIRNYIESWHEGDGNELRTKEEYFTEGFVKSVTDKDDYNFPFIIEDWILDENLIFVEFSIVKSKLD